MQQFTIEINQIPDVKRFCQCFIVSAIINKNKSNDTDKEQREVWVR